MNNEKNGPKNDDDLTDNNCPKYEEDFQIEDNPKTEDYSKLYGAGFK